MATTPSNYNRLPSALPGIRTTPGFPITELTRHRPMPDHQPMPRDPSVVVMLKEPEDARLTGGTRSLDRRLLALNLSRTGPAADAAQGPESLNQRLAS